jgi:hypothetical protein
MSAQQVKTFRCASASIMRHPHFSRGLEDVRTGKAFADSVQDEYWAYERGRLFGTIAPPSMPLFVDGRLNKKAVRLFEAASTRALIP